MPSTDDQRPFYRKKRTWLLILIAAPLAMAAAMFIVGQRELDRQLTALQEAGLPTNGEQLNDFYIVPDDVEDTTSLWMVAIQAVSSTEFEQAVGELPFVGRSDPPVVGDEWPELDAARQFIAAHADELETVRTAARAGGAVRFPVDFRAGINTMLQETNNTRTIARLLTLDAHVSQRDGNHQQALLDIIDIFALANSLEREPTSISQLVRMAIYGIACDTTQQLLPACEWTDKQLAALQSAATKMNSREAFILAMNGERAMGLTMIDSMPSMLGFRASNKSEMLRVYGLTIKSMELPWHEAIAEQQNVAAEIASKQGTLNRIRFAIVNTLLPASEQCTQAHARSSAKQLCIIAALAAERHRLAIGDFPESLSQIDPKYLPAEMANVEWVDPFNGKTLGYISSESGLTVYSVGQDLIDSKGDVVLKEEGNPTDVGFFLKR